MLNNLFSNPKPIIGVIHVAALPGAPANTLPVSEIIAQAIREAAVYRDCGVDGVIIENMHDAPYLRGSVGPEIVAAMAVIGAAVKTESRLPTGIQILAGANIEAMAVAHAADLGLGATAEAVEFMRADAVIVTGSVTGEAPKIADVEEAKANCRLPVLLGSGVDADNIADFYQTADGFIIGSYFKMDGHWANPVDAERVRRLMTQVFNSSSRPAGDSVSELLSP